FRIFKKGILDIGKSHFLLLQYLPKLRGTAVRKMHSEKLSEFMCRQEDWESTNVDDISASAILCFPWVTVQPVPSSVVTG
ncbi:hypothetical protein HispidOSU_005890, partial [Sigmodon hispidus]